MVGTRNWLGAAASAALASFFTSIRTLLQVNLPLGNEKIENRDADLLTGSKLIVVTIWKNEMLGDFLCACFYLQKSFKRDVSDTHGHQKLDLHAEAIAIDSRETDFRCTGTHFIIFPDFSLTRLA